VTAPILVIGDGAFGTSLAVHLASIGRDVRVFSHFPERAAELAAARENQRYLPGIRLGERISFFADPFAAAEGVQLALSAVPTQHLRVVARRFEDAIDGRASIVSASKGLEIETLKRPTEILAEELGDREPCVLVGPSHAEEIARGLPASVIVASADVALAERVQSVFMGGALRVYTTFDPLGAELAGALKNVIALAAGACDGLELGDNAKSALVTRGLVEMARFGVAHGARAETFFGLAGLGDLVTTCFSRHSRNRAVGERLARAVGVATTRALFGPESEGRASRMPIAEQVHAVLFEGKAPRDAVAALMASAPTSEMAGLFP
jgi:glycerol-3-phosphate dehydrogenase (NAD(P)+)